MSTKPVHEISTKEIADKLVHLCKQGKLEEAAQTLYSQDIVSIEPVAPPGGSRESRGIKAVEAKSKWWADNHEVHSAVVEGPIVGGTHFSVAFKFDVTHKPDKKRFTMEEVAVYKVEGGKIVQEEFFYSA